MELAEEFRSRMRSMLGDEYDAFEAALTGGEASAGIRINPLKRGAEEAVLPLLKNPEPVPWWDGGYYADKSDISGSHPYHRAGLFYFQEPSAMAAVAGIDISPGDRVLDLCAAPGGKATQAAGLLGGDGILVANEIIPKRAAVLRENIERLGIRNAVVLNEKPSALEDRFAGFFNKIIIDAPCSGEGMFRKEPLALSCWSTAHCAECGERQKRILDSAVKMLSDGGTLLYSTCTFSPEENEAAAEYLIGKGLTLVPMPRLDRFSPARGEYIGSRLDLSAARRIYPHQCRGEGHFAACFKKDGEYHPLPAAAVGEDSADKSKIKLYRDFEREYLRIRLEGGFTAYGDNLYLCRPMPKLSRLNVVMPGLYLGICKKGRFEPSRALAAALTIDDFASAVDFEPDSEEIAAYISGNVIESGKKGWCAVCAGGYPLGWAKGDGRVLKNHYPKGLRGASG